MSARFWVTLIRVVSADSDKADRSLRVNCTHVTGPHWIMEGDVDVLRDDGVKLVEEGEGAVGCLGDLDEAALKRVCLQSFGVHL